jgi:hypothetical protein
MFSERLDSYSWRLGRNGIHVPQYRDCIWERWIFTDWSIDLQLFKRFYCFLLFSSFFLVFFFLNSFCSQNFKILILMLTYWNAVDYVGNLKINYYYFHPCHVLLPPIAYKNNKNTFHYIWTRGLLNETSDNTQESSEWNY